MRVSSEDERRIRLDAVLEREVLGVRDLRLTVIRLEDLRLCQPVRSKRRLATAERLAKLEHKPRQDESG
jgi:hypothetical protein